MRRSNRGPDNASTRWPTRSARRTRDYTARTIAIAESLGFATGFTTRNDYARANEPALERSRFMMLAAITAADLAHRIAYAWPR